MGNGTDEPDGKPREYIRGKEDRSHASISNDLTLDTGSFEYIHIKDKDISYNFGGGANAGANYTGKPDEKNNTWSVNANYGFSQKRQTNFATIGEGTIIVREGNTDLSGLNRDVTKSQYQTVDIGLTGAFTLDSSTVALVTDPVGEIKNAITSLEKGYNDAKKTTVDQYQRTSNYMNDRGYYTNGEITKIGVDAALAVFTPDISQVKGSPNDKNIYDFLHEIYAGKISGNYDGKVASATLQQVASLYGMSSAEFKDAYQRGVIGNEFGNDITKILADNIDLDNAVADYSRRQVAIYEKQKLLANNQKDSSSTSLASTGVLVFGLAEGSTSLLPEGIAQTLTKINPITACGSLIFLQGDGDQRANSQDQKTSLATLAEFAKENPEQYLATYIVAKSYTENPALFQGDKLPVLVPEVILSDQPELLRLLPNNRQVDTENKNNTITTPRNDISVKDNLITTPGNYDAPLINVESAEKEVKKAPPANQGKAPQHGSEEHNVEVDKEVERMKQGDYKDIRKNQTQVDAKGNKVGNNRPDVQGINQKGEREYVEIDKNPRSSQRHGEVIKGNDPNGKIILKPLGGK